MQQDHPFGENPNDDRVQKRPQRIMRVDQLAAFHREQTCGQAEQSPRDGHVASDYMDFGITRWRMAPDVTQRLTRLSELNRLSSDGR